MVAEVMTMNVNGARRPLWAPLLAGLFLLSAIGWAEQVDKNELDTVKDRKIDFVNYEGSHQREDSKEEIRQLGRSVGQGLLRRGLASSGQAGDGRYYVIHVVDPSIKVGLDADIFVLGPGAGVDHVRNLRLIIAGYLEGAYGYSAADADTLAFFITIYNAVYRSDMDSCKARYKPAVMDKLSKENLGLALRYSEWPGKTRMLIPLGDAASKGGLGSVKTSGINDDKVTKELRKSDDKGVDKRKDLIDLKEKEIGEKGKNLEVKKEEVKKEDEKLKEDRRKLEEDKAKLGDDKAKLGDDGKTEGPKPSPGPGGPKEKAGLTEKAKDDTGEKAKLEERERDLEKREGKLEERRSEIKNEEAELDKARKETKEERSDVAKDMEGKIREENGVGAKEEKPAKTGVFFEALSLSGPQSRALVIDLDSGGTLKASQLNTINSRSVQSLGQDFICLAKTASGSRLLILDAASLQAKAEGQDPIFPDSFLVAKDGAYYALVERGGQCYLARFGADLKAQATSALTVHPYGALSFRAEGLVVQLADGGFAFLKASDLSLIKTLK